MRCVITVPQKIVTGAFNILFSFSEAIDFRVEDFDVDRLFGDPLGDPRDNLKGNGNHWVFQCYLPFDRRGRSRVSLNLSDVTSRPVEVDYDTIRTVRATWLTPVQMDKTTEVILFFDSPLRHLKKRHFRLSRPLPFQIYRVGDAYKIVIQGRVSHALSVSVSGSVVKANGAQGYIEESVLEI